jgi:X-X-X-Leu-X-X-Gly heptad repeat protein
MSNENVSLPVAEALASALAKIEAYVPTEYVDNSEPDIDAEHLNHAEQGIMRVTNLLNAAVDVIQGQESRLSDAETKVGTAALTGGMTDLSSGLNKLNSDFFNRIDATKISLLTQPSGTTIRQKIENCQKGTLCSWAHNPSELYNPTGKNGTWSFLIVRADKEMYTICLACEGGSKLYIYSYNANAWYGMDGTIVRQFN